MYKLNIYRITLDVSYGVAWVSDDIQLDQYQIFVVAEDPYKAIEKLKKTEPFIKFFERYGEFANKEDPVRRGDTFIICNPISSIDRINGLADIIIQ